MGNDANKRRVTGWGTTFAERKRTQIGSDKCGVTMVALSLWQNVVSIHRRILDQKREVGNKGGGKETYRRSFSRFLTSVACLVEGFPYISHTLGRIWEQLMY